MRRAGGFTLIEILVALTMFGIVGGMLLQLFGGGLYTAGQATEQTHAVLLARSKLAELQADARPRPGILSGDFTDGYRWQAELSIPREPLYPPTRTLAPLDLRLTVSWGPPEDDNRFVLDSLLLTEASAL